MAPPLKSCVRRVASLPAVDLYTGVDMAHKKDQSTTNKGSDTTMTILIHHKYSVRNHNTSPHLLSRQQTMAWPLKTCVRIVAHLPAVNW